MSILIKLIAWVIGAMLAFQLIIALIPISIILTGIAAMVCALINATICGIRDGNGASAWQGACNGAGWAFRTGVGILKTIAKLVFSFVRGLA